VEHGSIKAIGSGGLITPISLIGFGYAPNPFRTA
jgi:hypothetical protein